MRYEIFLISLVCMILFRSTLQAKNKCFEAKTCIHDGKEKCGQDKNGNIRRFLDTCDMKEYNCLKEADYDKVSLETCKELPMISESATEKNRDNLQQEVEEEDDIEQDEADNDEGNKELELNEEDAKNGEDESAEKKQKQ